MKRVKYLLSYVLVLSMCFTLFSFPVEASETPSYLPVEAGTFNLFERHEGSGYNIKFSGPVRLVTIGNNPNAPFLTLYAVSLQSFRYSAKDYGVPDFMNSYSSSSSYNGVTFYYCFFTVNYTSDGMVNPAPVPMHEQNLGASHWSAYYYTFGDGSIDPEPPISWGKPANVMFNTRIAGSGTASENNIDRIVWSPNIDSNANELPIDAKVQIRAVPGSYTADSEPNLLLKTYQDFVLDHTKQYIIYDGIASLGRFEIKWGEVVDHFNFFPYSWVPDIQLVDNYYLKMGWIYQIRLIIEDDDFESDWINIYTATSSGVEPSEIITNSDDLNQQLVQNIAIVNYLNQTNTVNWQINDTTINNSEYTEPSEGQKPWWAYLLEAIISLLNPNDETNIVINNTNNENQDLNNKLNEYNQIEDQQITNLDNSLEDITVESSILSDSKFVSSAQWVAQQYNRMTTGTVIGSIIGFSLLFGLALIFIGKIR